MKTFVYEVTSIFGRVFYGFVDAIDVFDAHDIVKRPDASLVKVQEI